MMEFKASRHEAVPVYVGCSCGTVNEEGEDRPRWALIRAKAKVARQGKIKWVSVETKVETRQFIGSTRRRRSRWSRGRELHDVPTRGGACWPRMNRVMYSIRLETLRVNASRQTRDTTPAGLDDSFSTLYQTAKELSRWRRASFRSSFFLSEYSMP